jgi:hypothetical protein
MPRTPFASVWERIIAHAGETFRTKKKLEFTYRVDRDGFFPSRTDYRISRSDFEKAYREVPLAGPGVINSEVRGPSYVWAVLHDRRVSRGEW